MLVLKMRIVRLLTDLVVPQSPIIVIVRADVMLLGRVVVHAVGEIGEIALMVIRRDIVPVKTLFTKSANVPARTAGMGTAIPERGKAARVARVTVARAAVPAVRLTAGRRTAAGGRAPIFILPAVPLTAGRRTAAGGRAPIFPDVR